MQGSSPFSSKGMHRDVSIIAENVFKERLQTIPGVSEIRIWGQKKYSMRLWINPDRLAAYQLTPLDVRNALSRENIELPAGSVEGMKTELTVRTLGRLTTPEDFNNLIIKEEGGNIVRFRDVGYAELGPENRVSPMASIGGAPQDLKYAGEPTRLVVGARNTIREFVTLNRGTAGGGGVTRIGGENLFMAYAHVGHDCQIGNRVIFANAATLAGHVEVGDDATVGAFSAIHQFNRVGVHGFVGGFSALSRDALPFMRTSAERPTNCYGPNSIGLERKGFSEDRRRAIKQAIDQFNRLLHFFGSIVVR